MSSFHNWVSKKFLPTWWIEKYPRVYFSVSCISIRTSSIWLGCMVYLQVYLKLNKWTRTDAELEHLLAKNPPKAPEAAPIGNFWRISYRHFDTAPNHCTFPLRQLLPHRALRSIPYWNTDAWRWYRAPAATCQLPNRGAVYVPRPVLPTKNQVLQRAGRY